jgi:hypothetical protein
LDSHRDSISSRFDCRLVRQRSSGSASHGFGGASDSGGGGGGESSFLGAQWVAVPGSHDVRGVHGAPIGGGGGLEAYSPESDGGGGGGGARWLARQSDSQSQLPSAPPPHRPQPQQAPHPQLALPRALREYRADGRLGGGGGELQLFLGVH